MSATYNTLSKILRFTPSPRIQNQVILSSCTGEGGTGGDPHIWIILFSSVWFLSRLLEPCVSMCFSFFQTFTGTSPLLAQGDSEGSANWTRRGVGCSEKGQTLPGVCVWPPLTLLRQLESRFPKDAVSSHYFPQPLSSDFCDAFHNYKGLQPIPRLLAVI